MENDNSTAVGVVVGRFQVSELTEGHREVLDAVLAKGHDRNVLVLGVSPVPPSANNPLDFMARAEMIRETYGDRFICVPLRDVPDDGDWSEALDRLLADTVGDRPVTLYGGRDSFAAHYSGRHRVDTVRQHIWCSGTESRAEDGDLHVASAEFRRGVVWATQRQYPHAYQTIDVALTDRFDNLYLCRKRTDPQDIWRFVGGFVDPADTSLECAAMRELREETGIDVGASRDDAGDYAIGATLAYVCSARVDDWRYRGERDGIMTALFAVHVNADMQEPRPADDICDVARFDDWWFKPLRVVPEHQPLMDALVRWFNEN